MGIVLGSSSQARERSIGKEKQKLSPEEKWATGRLAVICRSFRGTLSDFALLDVFALSTRQTSTIRSSKFKRHFPSDRNVSLFP